MDSGTSNPPKASGARDFAPWTDPAVQPVVRFERVSKRFGATTAVDRLSLDIFPGEFFALLGPSGCGKTTLLRMLAGFETPDDGRILLDGADVAAVPPYRRPVNMMFQNYALFPHLTVAGNIAFGLRQEGLPKADIAERVDAVMALLQLSGMDGRRPDQLSGGQRQRVALARSLVKRPRVLLLDEPMAALDKKLREETQFELMDLQARLGLTFVIVTHDQEEAMKVADRIGVMNHGQLIQVAPPEEIYEKPNSRWVADFIGDVNLIEGRVAAVDADGIVVETPGGVRLRAGSANGVETGAAVCVAVRPEKIAIGAAGGGPPDALHGEVIEIGYRGDTSVYRVRLDNGLVLKAAAANTRRSTGHAIHWNGRIALSWARESAMVLTR
jgi:putrescine transport system ATP-binding protein